MLLLFISGCNKKEGIQGVFVSETKVNQLNNNLQDLKDRISKLESSQREIITYLNEKNEAPSDLLMSQQVKLNGEVDSVVVDNKKQDGKANDRL
jgi:hypothetical protein